MTVTNNAYSYNISMAQSVFFGECIVTRRLNLWPRIPIHQATHCFTFSFLLQQRLGPSILGVNAWLTSVYHLMMIVTKTKDHLDHDDVRCSVRATYAYLTIYDRGFLHIGCV